jgi:hypothetical protein
VGLQQRQTIEALAHVGRGRSPAKPPSPLGIGIVTAARSARADSIADTVAGSTAPLIRSRAPEASSINHLIIQAPTCETDTEPIAGPRRADALAGRSDGR